MYGVSFNARSGFDVWGRGTPVDEEWFVEVEDEVAAPPAEQGSSLIRNSADRGPYSRAMPRALWWSWGEGTFL